MNNRPTRRELLKAGTAAALASIAAKKAVSAAPLESAGRTVRVGMVGVGNRGTSLLQTLLAIEGVEIRALCDLHPGNLARAQDIVQKKTEKRPDGYAAGPEDFRRMVVRDDLDAVMTATPWKWHTPVAVAAMEAKKYAATEVPAAVSVEDCWRLVNTSEATGMPFMMLENVCYFRDMLMVLNMVRSGLLGEMLCCEGGYQHDCRASAFDAKGEFGESSMSGLQLWSTIDTAQRNGNLYPTHPIGPIAQYLNIDHGDRFTHLVSMSTKSRGLNLWVKEKYGSDHPNARRNFAQGDINTTMIKTHNGCTVTLYYDSQSPRPYDLGFRVQGTKGIYSKTLDSIYVEGRSPRDAWETIEHYRDQYEHPLWKKFGRAAQGHGHGGADYITLERFIRAVRSRTAPEQDVYDAATWSVISPLSEMSVARGSAPVEFPDFTRGKWSSRAPVGIVNE
jgi:predicted dehydrogenase